ncbi:MAG: ferrochelatase [Gemmatimonadales bacterium]
MSLGLLYINFGEPDEPTAPKVSSFLERIFLRNASLEGHVDDAAVARSRELARGRTPALLEAYQAIGGSPMNAQSAEQAGALGAELRRRGVPTRVYAGFQFTEPTVAACVERARSDGVTRLIAVPGYPLCGQSTTAAALEDVRAALDELAWDVPFLALAGWHHHPDYLRLHADHIRQWTSAKGLDLGRRDTILYFSVHGTPLKYLEAGNRYDRYAFEHCRDVAASVGADRYAVGFQNHGNRRIPWTQPDNERRIRDLNEKRLVVVPISFMKEQSETLSELDVELRAFVESLGKELHRVPVPHAAPALPTYLAGRVEELISGDPSSGGSLSRCRCCPWAGVWCTNGSRELPPSPYAIAG